MLSTANFHFRLLTPEAQRAALQRLALHGWDAKTISVHTGVPEADVLRQLDAAAPAVPSQWQRRQPTRPGS